MDDGTFPPLEVACPVCNGSGRTEDESWYERLKVECNHCDGTGNVTTPFGDAVMDFVQRRLQLYVTVGRDR